ncbi:MAG: ROK family transcriptional regulator [Pyrinomonadaceae bacterium]|nr:ROK family transcriptional regulator [Pyrinomonadaceae bacterium]
MKRIYLQKAKNQIARPNTIRDINKQIVLNYVRERAPISRAEIARETELQRSTVSAIVDELQTTGLIEEIGIGDSTGGRKPTLLRLKTGNPVAIGVDLDPRKTTIAVADLAGKVLEKEDFPTSHNAEFMSNQILEKIGKIISKYKDSELEVGISVPGIADQVNGKTLYIPYFQWHDWDICQQINEKLGIYATIDNDANAIAVAELWFGRESIRKVSNFITVLVSQGIGTGIVFEGQVYRGEKGAAGEFGHMIVGVEAPVPCSCGGNFCWESNASESAIIGRYEKSFMNNGHPLGSSVVTLPMIISLAEQGEKQAIDALRESAKFLGIGIANLIVGLSPQAVIISGNITKAWHIIKDEILSVAERGIIRDLPHPSIMASTLGDQPTLIGALSLVLARKFASATMS